ncbi:MAG: FAD-dependent oxidoreductase [Planctomycetes bacterium]|nr:FAD-dependent oxidoreductase [Planctomycetota bacterium]
MKREANGRITFTGAADIPLNARSEGRMEHNRTGSWRVQEPYYADLTPPCVAKCPAGTDISKWIGAAAQGNLDLALEIFREANPFPALCGRVCPHPCESACSRASVFEGAVAVHDVERAIGDHGLKSGARLEPRAARVERVAVIGSGPAGLSCAFYLGRQGFRVMVFEALPVLGGLLRTGIPPYRLPPEILDAELRVFEGLPVTFVKNRRLGDNLVKADLSRFDAVFLGVGRQASRKMGVPGENLPGVYEGTKYLRESALGHGVKLEGRVCVVGGGNTAMDCARVALRDGAEPTVVYRRLRPDMPAFPEEVNEARDEGVQFVFQASPAAVTARDGKVASLRCLRTRPGAPDASGRRSVEPVPGSEFELACESVLVAAGEEVDRGPLEGMWLMNGRVFSGGDLENGATVSEAIGHGRRAAAAIERKFTGKTGILEDLPAARGARPDLMPLDRVNVAWFRGAARLEPPHADLRARAHDFREINCGFDRETAVSEARRCLSCGTCTACDNCLVFCPDNAIVREGNGYRILHEFCKGCGICAEECPRGAIHIKRVGT